MKSRKSRQWPAGKENKLKCKAGLIIKCSKVVVTPITLGPFRHQTKPSARAPGVSLQARGIYNSRLTGQLCDSCHNDAMRPLTGLHLCHTELGTRPSSKTQVGDKEVSQKRCKFEKRVQSLRVDAVCQEERFQFGLLIFFLFLRTDVVFYQAELKRCFWKSTLTVHRIW